MGGGNRAVLGRGKPRRRRRGEPPWSARRVGPAVQRVRAKGTPIPNVRPWRVSSDARRLRRATAPPAVASPRDVTASPRAPGEGDPRAPFPTGGGEPGVAPRTSGTDGAHQGRAGAIGAFRAILLANPRIEMGRNELTKQSPPRACPQLSMSSCLVTQSEMIIVLDDGDYFAVPRLSAAPVENALSAVRRLFVLDSVRVDTSIP